MKQTDAQRERQKTRDNTGRYKKLNPCQLCGNSAGANYCSDHRTDCTDSAGNRWGDIALVLCGRCGTRLAKMDDNAAYKLLLSKRAA